MRDEVEPSPVFHRVVALARERPGSCLTDLAREAGVDVSTVAYHVRRAVKRGILASEYQGRELVVYPPDACPLLKHRVAAVRAAADVADAIVDGARTIEEVAERTGAGKPRVKNGVRILGLVGLLARESPSKFGPTEDLEHCLRALAGVCDHKASGVQVRDVAMTGMAHLIFDS